MRTLIYLLALAAAPALAQTVKVTPLGSHDGELCAFDRALIFEDPDGTRVLYDAGRTVRAPAMRGSARSTPSSSRMCTATTSAIRIHPPPTPAPAPRPMFPS